MEGYDTGLINSFFGELQEGETCEVGVLMRQQVFLNSAKHTEPNLPTVTTSSQRLGSLLSRPCRPSVASSVCYLQVRSWIVLDTDGP